jgi:hypothetical protein
MRVDVQVFKNLIVLLRGVSMFFQFSNSRSSSISLKNCFELIASVSDVDAMNVTHNKTMVVVNDFNNLAETKVVSRILAYPNLSSKTCLYCVAIMSSKQIKYHPMVKIIISLPAAAAILVFQG